jgi:hypothetical protein
MNRDSTQSVARYRMESLRRQFPGLSAQSADCAPGLQAWAPSHLMQAALSACSETNARRATVALMSIIRASACVAAWAKPFVRLDVARRERSRFWTAPRLTVVIISNGASSREAATNPSDTPQDDPT